MSFIKELKEFAIKGDFIDLAVAFIIGAAFNAVVTSLVQDIMMPPIGYLIGGVNFADLQVTLSTAGEGVAIRYGLFVETIINFLLIALSVFVMVKIFTKLSKSRKK